MKKAKDLVVGDIVLVPLSEPQEVCVLEIQERNALMTHLRVRFIEKDACNNQIWLNESVFEVR